MKNPPGAGLSKALHFNLPKGTALPRKGKTKGKAWTQSTGKKAQPKPDKKAAKK